MVSSPVTKPSLHKKSHDLKEQACKFEDHASQVTGNKRTGSSSHKAIIDFHSKL